jgi:hypothetical protein
MTDVSEIRRSILPTRRSITRNWSHLGIESRPARKMPYVCMYLFIYVFVHQSTIDWLSSRRSSILTRRRWNLALISNFAQSHCCWSNAGDDYYLFQHHCKILHKQCSHGDRSTVSDCNIATETLSTFPNSSCTCRIKFNKRNIETNFKLTILSSNIWPRARSVLSSPAPDGGTLKNLCLSHGPRGNGQFWLGKLYSAGASKLCTPQNTHAAPPPRSSEISSEVSIKSVHSTLAIRHETTLPACRVSLKWYKCLTGSPGNASFWTSSQSFGITVKKSPWNSRKNCGSKVSGKTYVF